MATGPVPCLESIGCMLGEVDLYSGAPSLSYPGEEGQSAHDDPLLIHVEFRSI